MRAILTADVMSLAASWAASGAADTLQTGAARSSVPGAGLLRGRRIGLMSPSNHSADAKLLHHAAAELGMRVSHIAASLDQESSIPRIHTTAQLLSRLYDAVECQGVDSAVVHRLAESATIPIYLGLATHDHPSARLANTLPGSASMEKKRAWVLQAMLLRSIP